MLVLLAVATGDKTSDVQWMSEKLLGLRIFGDAEGKMNLSLRETAGEMLVVSQFTLMGDCRKGRRPSFVDAAPPEEAKQLYLELVRLIKVAGVSVQTGRFRELMHVNLVNNGPVTMLLDSRKLF